jgi:hypothetical protein
VGDLFGSDIELDHPHILVVARGWPKCMIQLNLAPIKKTTSACCNARLGDAPTDSG